MNFEEVKVLFPYLMEDIIFRQLILSTFAFATPLLLAALGELIGERAGVLNISLEGMMLVGAWCGAAASFGCGSGWIGLLAAVFGGMIFAALFALLTFTFKGDAIVVGTGINLLALGATGVAHRALGSHAANYTSVALPQWIFSVAGIMLTPLLWWFLKSTFSGLRLRAVGEYPLAAEAAGIPVLRMRWTATLINGAFCGLAGAFLSMSHTNSFAENMTAGRGFIALAIVIFGRWNPWGALGAALLFGAAEGAQFYLQTFFANAAWGAILYPLLIALPYFFTLFTLAGYAGKSRAPAALAQPLED